MSRVTLTVLGCGDAFASGGRHYSTYLIEWGRERLLLDCGATAATVLRQHGIAPLDLTGLLITHPHGDHFGGLPFLFLDFAFQSVLTNPVEVMGPPAVYERTRPLIELLYPGLVAQETALPWSFQPIRPGQVLPFRGARVEAFDTIHMAPGEALSYRIQIGDKVIAFSGDTGWHDDVPRLARGADLFLCECSSFDQEVPYHMCYRRLEAERHRLEAKRIVLVHLGSDVLNRLDDVAFETANEGAVYHVE